MALFIAKVETRLGGLSRISVCPEGIEIVISVNGSAGIGVIAFAILCQLSGVVPGATSVTAFPHGHFSARVIGLGAGLGRRDYAIGAIGFEIQRSHVVVAVGNGDGTEVPITAGPAQNCPDTRAIFRTRLVSSAGDDQDDRIAVRIESNILEINLESFGSIIMNQCIILCCGEWQIDLLSRSILPGLPTRGWRRSHARATSGVTLQA